MAILARTDAVASLEVSVAEQVRHGLGVSTWSVWHFLFFAEGDDIDGSKSFESSKLLNEQSIFFPGIFQGE